MKGRSPLPLLVGLAAGVIIFVMRFEEGMAEACGGAFVMFLMAWLVAALVIRAVKPKL